MRVGLASVGKWRESAHTAGVPRDLDRSATSDSLLIPSARKDWARDKLGASSQITESVLFTHAQRFEFVPQGHNPISLVRQTGKRSRIPDILEPWEINAIWLNSSLRERAAISIAYGNGLRVSEEFALKWHNLDASKGTALVTKGIVKGHLGEVKTEISKKLVPLHAYQLEDLAAWRAVSPYNGDDDWVFASDRNRGRKPYWPQMILRRHIQKTAKKLGIVKKIGWHTFRRTYASLLTANKEDVKVVQELMRHATPTMALGLYAQAFGESARAAQSKIVEMVRNAPMPDEFARSRSAKAANVR